MSFPVPATPEYDKMAIRMGRFKHEVEMLTKNPPPGIHCWAETTSDNVNLIKVHMTGPEDSPYERGIFELEVRLGDRYPFAPPFAKFITPVYHPNIDDKGRICLSALKPKPLGSWNVTYNIPIVLSAIRILLTEPNLSDPLMADIAREYQTDYTEFRKRAREMTMKFAVKSFGGEGQEEQEEEAK